MISTNEERQKELSLWGVWITIAVILAVHIVVYIVTAHTDYAICLSKLSVHGPAERDWIVRQFAAEQGTTSAADCCQLSKRAGEFQLGYRDYIESGAVWTVRTNGTPQTRSKMLGFLTNCGEALSERDYLKRYVI